MISKDKLPKAIIDQLRSVLSELNYGQQKDFVDYWGKLEDLTVDSLEDAIKALLTAQLVSMEIKDKPWYNGGEK